MSGAGFTQEALRKVYAGKRVLVTGHTGFKGSWLTLWLAELGAQVTGYALAPDTTPALFNVAGVAQACRHHVSDLRDLDALRAVFEEAKPECVFHLAAQPLVRRSYEQPLETLQTNVLGTGHLLEVIRTSKRPCALVVVTSDKCYENREWLFGYREDEAMGGHDVYSMSKGAAELVTSSYRRSFFPPQKLAAHGVAIASARAGNVVGGGDWAPERIVVDCIGALARGQPIPVRNPGAVRPWQHVLEPLGGYLLLGAKLLSADAAAYCEPFNFGPRLDSTCTVRELVATLTSHWGSGEWEDRRDPNAPHEANLLRLSIEKAWVRLGWAPRWGLSETLAKTVQWYRAHHDGASTQQLRELCLAQLREYAGLTGSETGG